MATREAILTEMETILDQLIKVATKMREVSAKDFAEETISPLQTKQEDLMTKLKDLDKAYIKIRKKTETTEIAHLHKRIEEKLDYFQKLNSAFIDGLASSKGVLPFNLPKSPKLLRPAKEAKNGHD